MSLTTHRSPLSLFIRVAAIGAAVAVAVVLLPLVLKLVALAGVAALVYFGLRRVFETAGSPSTSALVPDAVYVPSRPAERAPRRSGLTVLRYDA